jgi:hypothetical protein
MGRFLHGNDHHFTPFKYKALGDSYCIKNDNLKRDDITDMYSSAVLAQDNYLMRKHPLNKDSYMFD